MMKTVRNGKIAPIEADSGNYIKNQLDLKLDRNTELWNELERKLLRAQPPRRIVCAFEPKEYDIDEGTFVERRYLGIQRHGGKWRICHAVTWDNRGEDTLPWKPVVECDAETRMDATERIEQLTCQVRDTGRTFIPALDNANSLLEDAIAALEGAIGDGDGGDDETRKRRLLPRTPPGYDNRVHGRDVE